VRRGVEVDRDAGTSDATSWVAPSVVGAVATDPPPSVRAVAADEAAPLFSSASGAASMVTAANAATTNRPFARYVLRISTLFPGLRTSGELAAVGPIGR
jgi:hypothetical protein